MISRWTYFRRRNNSGFLNERTPDGLLKANQMAPRARWYAPLICRMRGHAIKDDSGEWSAMPYQSTNLDDGSTQSHTARQRSIWIYCTRCGIVIDGGVGFDGFTIPGRSSVGQR